MNKSIFKSLKPGGYYIVEVDHKAAESAGDDVTRDPASHQGINRRREEVEAAGFKLVAEGKDLTFPSDDGTKWCSRMILGARPINSYSNSRSPVENKHLLSACLRRGANFRGASGCAGDPGQGEAHRL